MRAQQVESEQIREGAQILAPGRGVQKVKQFLPRNHLIRILLDYPRRSVDRLIAVEVKLVP